MISQLPIVMNLLEGDFAQVRVLVVGDIMIDRYLIGEVERISPEAPVPVLRHVHRYERPGGAANVAMNVAALGCETFLCGFWGQDGEQAELARLLEAAKIDTTGVVTSSLPTTSKTRFVARTQQLLRLDIEGDGPPPMEESTRLEARAVELVKKVHAVILVDRAKGSLTDDISAAILRAARAASIESVVQPRTREMSKYSGASMICPHLNKLAGMTGVAVDDTERMLAVARVQMLEHDIRCMAIPMQENGIRVLCDDEDIHVDGRAGEIFDVAGADDSVIAVLAASLACGLKMKTAVELANVASGIVLGKVGAVPVSREELVAALQSEED